MSGIYPTFEDKDFNLKIHAKKEFRDYENKEDINNDFDKKFEEICNADFELTNHQFFVKNYLSPNTPYNSLLLYHGLGTGKTCSAINICEEIRKIYKRMAYNKRIMVIASPNVQNNFKSQLFDETKLKKDNGMWKLNNTCIGNVILDELFPKQNNNLSKENIVSTVNRFINKHYLFMGYIEFANYIKKLEDKNRPFKEEFDNRLIVIDEVHNMKTTCDKADTRCAYYLKLLVDKVKFMKLVFLTATPMFNSYDEIFEILNLMRSNDDLKKIDEREIVDKDGNFIKDPNTGEEVGLHKFIDYSRGYISYVRGENPYSFPFRILPGLHSPEKSLTNQKSYPNYSPDKELISEDNKIKYLDLYINNLSRTSFQHSAYQLVKNKHKVHKIATPSIMNSLNQILNFAYPDSIESVDYKGHETLYGKDGIKRLMDYKEKKLPNPNKDSDITRSVSYAYKTSTSTDYGNVFHPDIIGEYSHKLKNISTNISESEGIILIYSQYIEGGLIPTALMLEEMGFNRYDGENLLKTTLSKTKKKLTHNYVIISGDKRFSSNNNKAVSVCSQPDNKNGALIKVILISKAASEGIDFKFIRQVHILDPWYNLNRNEQIVGRAIRMCSHKNIPFEKRNVSIFFHATNLDNNEEASDIYQYRLCEQKSIQISKISRLLKQNAVDCMLNIKQSQFTEENFNKTVKLTLSNKQSVDFNVGDKPYSLFCDFDRTCSYNCINNKNIYSTSNASKLDESTYNFTFLENNSDIVVQKIINYFANNAGVATYTGLQDLFSKHPFTMVQFAIDKLVKAETTIYDKYDREGSLVVIGDFILFKPANVYPKSSVYDRLHPSHSKHVKINFKYNQKFDVKEGKDNDKKFIQEIRASLYEYFNESIIDYKSFKDANWYQLALFSIKEQLGQPLEEFDFVIYGHLLDDLDFEKKLKLINYVYKTDRDDNILLDKRHIKGIKNIIENNSFHLDDDKTTKAINIQHGKISLYVLHDEVWKPATLQELKLYRKIKSNILNTQLKEQTNTIGFIQEYNKTYSFKLKNMADIKKTGYRCDQSKKDTVHQFIKILLEKNEIYNEGIELSTYEGKKISTYSNCVLLEILLRYSHIKNIENQIWFIDVFQPVIISQLKKKLNE